MNFEKDVLKVSFFRTKKALCSDILMMLNSHLCEPSNQSRLDKLSSKISRKFSRSYLDSYWLYLFKKRMEF